ncbi:NAD(P)-binding protein [Xylariaceae sp. FL0255]|nr:NAD(P)-binding protein [Xylariaceae sp. FL0255]
MPPPRGTPNPIEGPGDYDTTSIVHSDTYPEIDPTKADLSGKVVFITGATKGLGKGISISFAKAGASKFAIGARSNLGETSQAIREAAANAGKPEPTILELKIDVTNQESVETAAEEIKKKFGRVDIVINNAGLLSGRGLIAETDPEEWWDTMAVNVKGPYLVMRALIPLMLELKGGQTSKLAVLRLTEFLNIEYSDRGILAFAIHPGNVPTDMLKDPGGELPDFLVPGKLASLSILSV